jgi:hypothetical protein
MIWTSLFDGGIMEDISAIIIKIDLNLSELKRLTRTPAFSDNERITQIILDMRWQLSQALTSIGKNAD